MSMALRSASALLWWSIEHWQASPAIFCVWSVSCIFIPLICRVCCVPKCLNFFCGSAWRMPSVTSCCAIHPNRVTIPLDLWNRRPSDSGAANATRSQEVGSIHHILDDCRRRHRRVTLHMTIHAFRKVTQSFFRIRSARHTFLSFD
jgi:hypothetical protein